MKEALRSHQSHSKCVTQRSNGKRFRHRFRSRIYGSILVALAALALLAGPGFYSSPAGAQSGQARLQQDIEQVFTRHEEITLDPQAAAERVRESGRLSLVTPTHDFEIQLRPNDLRASNYRAEEVVAGGVTRAVSMPGITTYKGNVEGTAGTDARFTLDGDHIEGMIITPQDSYFVEAARKYSVAAGANDYLLYKASDVRPDITRVCGTLDEEITRGAKEIAPSVASGTVAPAAVFSPFKVVEIATEADGEYTTALGGSAAANNDILSIMNQIQAIYQRDIGLTFTVVFQHTWTDASSDPYTTTGDPTAMINEFKTVWNRDFTGTPRDVAHLWTGRNLGGPNGIAFVGVVCSAPPSAYGLSDLETIAPFRVTIPAHEIGHNFGARHPDDAPVQAGCDNTIMVSTQSQSNTSTFCQFSIDEITNYVNLNSSCLSNAPPAGNPIDQPDFFVRQQYLDFLNRTADPSGLAFWINELASCGADQACIDSKRVNVSAAFYLSIEFQKTGSLVYLTHKAAVGSKFPGAAPVPVLFSQFKDDTQTIQQGLTFGQPNFDQTLDSNKRGFFANFVARPQFEVAFPATQTPPEFVDALIANTGVVFTGAARTGALNLFGGATTSASRADRAGALQLVAENPTFAAAEFNRTFVAMEYFGYLRRDPDASGFNFWLNKLNQANGNFVNSDMVKSFIVSGEYRQRFGTP